MRRAHAALSSALVAALCGCAASHTRASDAGSEGGAECVALLPDDPDGNAAQCARARAEGRPDLGACARHADWYARAVRCASSEAPPASCTGEERAAYLERVEAAREQCTSDSGHHDFVWERTRYWRAERWIWVGSLETGHWDYSLSAPAIVDTSPASTGCTEG